MNFPWNKAWGHAQHHPVQIFTSDFMRVWINFSLIGSFKIRCEWHVASGASTSAVYSQRWVQGLPWRWSARWSGSTWGGPGWWTKLGWSAGSSYPCQRIRTGSTWGSAPRETTRRTTPYRRRHVTSRYLALLYNTSHYTTLRYRSNAQSREMQILPCYTTIVESFLAGEDDPQSSAKVLGIHARYLTRTVVFNNQFRE